MCELLALSARCATRLSLSLAALASHSAAGMSPRDGWGLACHDAQGVDIALFREPQAAADSALVQWLQSGGPVTRLALAHIRHATQGAAGVLANTQPFVRELGGRMHSFAHNGHLHNIADSPLRWGARFRLLGDAEQVPADARALVRDGLLGANRSHSLGYGEDLQRRRPPETGMRAPRGTCSALPLGDTDSEVAFCALLERLHQAFGNDVSAAPLDERLAQVAAFAAQLRRLGPANFLYADGQTLFVHSHRRTQSDGRIAPPGLHLLTRRCTSEREGLSLSGVRLDCGFQQVTLAASVPLSNEAWRPMAEGELVAIVDGEVRAALFAD